MRRGEVWLINLDPTIGAEIRTLSQKRFVRRLGQLTELQMQELTEALAAVLSISK